MNRLDALIRKRATDRVRSAKERIGRILRDAEDRGVRMTIVGSLAKNAFQLHSDIDLLVHGSVAPRRRAMVERLVAEHMRDAAIPYDLIFEADLSPERVEELLHDVV
jgi:predicted nucleotidyltransferase